MAFRRITNYQAGINPNGKGDVFCQLEGGGKADATGLEPAAFIALMTILSRPVPVYNTATKMFAVEEDKLNMTHKFLSLNNVNATKNEKAKKNEK